MQFKYYWLVPFRLVEIFVYFKISVYSFQFSHPFWIVSKFIDMLSIHLLICQCRLLCEFLLRSREPPVPAVENPLRGLSLRKFLFPSVCCLFLRRFSLSC